MAETTFRRREYLLGGFYRRQVRAAAGGRADRVLNGPTSDVWIDPWVYHLPPRRLRIGHSVEGIRCSEGHITGLTMTSERATA